MGCWHLGFRLKQEEKLKKFCGSGGESFFFDWNFGMSLQQQQLKDDDDPKLNFEHPRWVCLLFRNLSQSKQNRVVMWRKRSVILSKLATSRPPFLALGQGKGEICILLLTYQLGFLANADFAKRRAPPKLPLGFFGGGFQTNRGPAGRKEKEIQFRLLQRLAVTTHNYDSQTPLRVHYEFSRLEIRFDWSSGSDCENRKFSRNI